MSRLTPAAILTYLNTNWVTETIAKPTFVNQFENEMIRSERALAVNWVGFEWESITTGAVPLDSEDNSFLIQIVEDTLANLLLSMDMARSLMLIYSTTAGYCHIDSGNPMKVGGHYEVFLNLSEIIGAV